MTTRFFLFVCIFLLLPFNVLHASDAMQLLRQGNSYFNEGRFAEAEKTYRQSLEHDTNNFRAWFNLANALYKQGKMDEAASILETLTHQAPNDQALANTWHNLGNTFLGSGQFAESVDAFKHALRLSPDDEDTRYNLAYAQNLLEEMPPQDQSPQGDDQGEGDDEQGDEDRSPDMSDQDESDQDESEQSSTPESEQTPQQQPDQLSPEDARRMLDALNRQEASIQENINRQEKSTQTVRTLRQW